MSQNLIKELNNNKWKGKPGHRTGEEACGPNTNCVNLEWGYDCECAPGYEVNPQGIVPIDRRFIGDFSVRFCVIVCGTELSDR